MKILLVLIFSLFIVGAEIINEQDYVFTISTDERELTAYPVSVELPRAIINDQQTGCIIYDMYETPAQIETGLDGRVIVWFVTDQPAYTSRKYRLRIGKDCSDAKSFTWKERQIDATQLLFNGQPVIQYEHPVFDPENIEDTKKPYHHVFSPDGDRKITKGPGGLYSHHRGIFFGYNKIGVEDNEYDIWHAQNGEHSEHVDILRSFSGPVMGGHIVRIEWRGRDGVPFIDEIREIRVFRQPAGRSLIDFRSTLSSLRGIIELDGDLHHAGVQFRASQYVADNIEESRFIRPMEWSHFPEDQEMGSEDFVDLPWNAFNFSVDENRFTVIYMSHPDNPPGAEFSERMYGRFGEFFPYVLSEVEPLTVQYRFAVYTGNMVDRETIRKQYEDYAHPPAVESGIRR